MDLSKILAFILLISSSNLLHIHRVSAHEESDDDNESNPTGISRGPIDSAKFSNQEPRYLVSTATLSQDVNQQTKQNHFAHSLRKSTRCIPTPQNLTFCSVNLGWAPYMSLPNFLGHKADNELLDMLTTFPISEISSIKCKSSDQLKLLLCSIMSPVCLDVVAPPCRRLCIAAKSSCEPALRRKSLEWPKFLDCRKFARSQDSCIDRQPLLESGFQSIQTTSDKLQHEFHLNVSSTTNRPGTKRKRKENKNKINHTTSTVSTLPDPPTRQPEAQNHTQLEEKQAGSSLTERYSTTTTSPINTMTVAITSMTSTTETQDLTTNSELTSSHPHGTISTERANQFTQDYSSMPVNVTDDLTQLICSKAPDWLIKTKLTDSQLMNAAIRQKLKVRSYRQIFGPSLADKASPAGNVGSDHKVGKNVSTALYLHLTNSTLFATAIGVNIYTQPMGVAPAKVNTNQDQPESKSMRYYLVAGTGSANSSKLTTIFVVWPGGRLSMDSDSQGGVNIVKTYREFKRRGSDTCNQSTLTNTSLRAPSMTETSDESKFDPQAHRNTQISRRPKRKRIQSADR